MEEQERMTPYLMHPNLFVQLSFVRGFNQMNGEKYQSHILMVLEDRLTTEEKLIIMSTRTPEDALEALTKLGIEYTHDMEN